MEEKIGLELLRIGVRMRINILIHRTYGHIELYCRDGLGEFLSRRCHKRGMEGSTHLQGKTMLCPGFLHLRDSSLDGLLFA